MSVSVIPWLSLLQEIGKKLHGSSHFVYICVPNIILHVACIVGWYIANWFCSAYEQIINLSFWTKQWWCCNPLLLLLKLNSYVLVAYYTPRFNEVDRGVYWYHLVRLSVCPSVRLSVCGQNRVRSVSSTILIGSISYLHILSSNLIRCVACNARFKIQKFEILANFLNL